MRTARCDCYLILSQPNQCHLTFIYFISQENSAGDGSHPRLFNWLPNFSLRRIRSIFFSFLFNPMTKTKKTFTNMLPTTFKINSAKLVEFSNKRLINKTLNPLIIDIGSTTLVIYESNSKEYTFLNIIILPSPIAKLITIAPQMEYTDFASLLRIYMILANLINSILQ